MLCICVLKMQFDLDLVNECQGQFDFKELLLTFNVFCFALNVCI